MSAETVDLDFWAPFGTQDSQIWHIHHIVSDWLTHSIAREKENVLQNIQNNKKSSVADVLSNYHGMVL